MHHILLICGLKHRDVMLIEMKLDKIFVEQKANFEGHFAHAYTCSVPYLPFIDLTLEK